MLKKIISVIVPVYNIEDYVENCIQSIINQTYSDLEIILVDDGSTDKSGKICDDFAKKDQRIRVYHKENGGLSDARNYAIELAQGDFLAFVDGDDWIHPQMYEIMSQVLEKEGADIVTCRFEREDKCFLQKRFTEKEVNYKILSREEAISQIDVPLVVAWNKLYKKRIFDNIRYPYGRYHEDEFVIHEIFWKCNCVVAINNPLYFYTIRENSIIATLTPKRIEDALCALENRVDFVAKTEWDAVLPAVIRRYCDYTIDRYINIREGKEKIDKEWLEKLHLAEKLMLSKYSSVPVPVKYIKFSNKPESYYKSYKRQQDIEKFKDRIRALKIKICR